MPAIKDATVYAALESPSNFIDMVSQGDSPEVWVRNLPPGLSPYRSELEGLLGRVFKGGLHTPHNLELAQQMTLNWCVSKCRKIGIEVAD